MTSEETGRSPIGSPRRNGQMPVRGKRQWIAPALTIESARNTAAAKQHVGAETGQGKGPPS